MANRWMLAVLTDHGWTRRRLERSGRYEQGQARRGNTTGVRLSVSCKEEKASPRLDELFDPPGGLGTELLTGQVVKDQDVEIRQIDIVDPAPFMGEELDRQGGVGSQRSVQKGEIGRRPTRHGQHVEPMGSHLNQSGCYVVLMGDFTLHRCDSNR